MISLIVYSFLFLVSYPFILMDSERYCEENNIPLNYRVLAIIVAAIPFMNIYSAIPAFINWISYKMTQRRLKKLFKKSSDPEITKAGKRIDDIFIKYSKIKL